MERFLTCTRSSGISTWAVAWSDQRRVFSACVGLDCVSSFSARKKEGGARCHHLHPRSRHDDPNPLDKRRLEGRSNHGGLDGRSFCSVQKLWSFEVGWGHGMVPLPICVSSVTMKNLSSVSCLPGVWCRVSRLCGVRPSGGVVSVSRGMGSFSRASPRASPGASRGGRREGFSGEGVSRRGSPGPERPKGRTDNFLGGLLVEFHRKAQELETCLQTPPTFHEKTTKRGTKGWELHFSGL